jgi:hypothetical protein
MSIQSNWQWDYAKDTWVAQVELGKNVFQYEILWIEPELLIHVVSKSYVQVRFTFSDPYYLYGGCKRGDTCGSYGKSCVGEEKCPEGCYFAECLQHARSSNADGFSFRGGDSNYAFCRICKRDQINKLQEEKNSGVYIKKGKKYWYFNIKKIHA